jgi:hypothetical protein
MMRWSNLLVWIPVGAILSYLLFGAIQQKQHLAEVVERLESFRSVGPRFTAQDGDELCRDIQALQRRAGLEARECRFGE